VRYELQNLPRRIRIRDTIRVYTTLWDPERVGWPTGGGQTGNNVERDDSTQCFKKFVKLLAFILAEWWWHKSGGRQETV